MSLCTWARSSAKLTLFCIRLDSCNGHGCGHDLGHWPTLQAGAATAGLAGRILEELMTCCLGILLPEGLVLASDSRSNAGVDQVALVLKLALYEVPGQRALVVVLSAGNWMSVRKRCAEGFSSLGARAAPYQKIALDISNRIV